MKKERADKLLVERGLVESRARARAVILAGLVFSGEERVDKAGQTLPVDAPLRVKGPDHPFVSRGGVKLAGALDALGIPVEGVRAADFGASTGGFTDCLLQRGAAEVVAIDVGYGQLHHKLRTDPRVEVRERTNARHLQASDVEPPVELVVIDASFISIRKLLPAAANVLASGGRVLGMVKPQFELGREAMAKTKGVVRDPRLRTGAADAASEAAAELGLTEVGRAESVLAGPEGNVEIFVLWRASPGAAARS